MERKNASTHRNNGRKVSPIVLSVATLALSGGALATAVPAQAADAATAQTGTTQASPTPRVIQPTPEDWKVVSSRSIKQTDFPSGIIGKLAVNVPDGKVGYTYRLGNDYGGGNQPGVVKHGKIALNLKVSDEAYIGIAGPGAGSFHGGYVYGPKGLQPNTSSFDERWGTPLFAQGSKMTFTMKSGLKLTGDGDYPIYVQYVPAEGNGSSGVARFQSSLKVRGNTATLTDMDSKALRNGQYQVVLPNPNGDTTFATFGVI